MPRAGAERGEHAEHPPYHWFPRSLTITLPPLPIGLHQAVSKSSMALQDVGASARLTKRVQGTEIWGGGASSVPPKPVEEYALHRESR